VMVSDALGMWDPYEGDMALRQIESKNIEWLTVEQVADRYSVAAKTRATREARAKARAARGQVSGRTAASKTTRRAFRI
jgi:hypothetical protein